MSIEEIDDPIDVNFISINNPQPSTSGHGNAVVKSSNRISSLQVRGPKPRGRTRKYFESASQPTNSLMFLL